MSTAICSSFQDPKKALNPTEKALNSDSQGLKGLCKVAQHFAEGETFGVYGEILPASQREVSKKEEEKIPVTILTGLAKKNKKHLLPLFKRVARDVLVALRRLLRLWEDHDAELPAAGAEGQEDRHHRERVWGGAH